MSRRWTQPRDQTARVPAGAVIIGQTNMPDFAASHRDRNRKKSTGASAAPANGV